ncbi:MAG: ATP-dependent zinc metalloprotease FtsH [Deltaproteobacteria bacterium]|nr:ATP-dependent zinc metalloprotease FtsH [Deltaproteobacteria bacterium]
MRQSHKTIILWGVLIFMFWIIWSVFSAQRGEVHDAQFSQFLEAVKTKTVDSVVINKAKGEFRWKQQNKEYATQGVLYDDLFKELSNSGINFKFEEEDKSNFWQQFIIAWLPILLLFVFVFIFMRQMQSGGGKAMSFGKSRAKLITDNQNKVTFKDVAGIDEAKEECEEIIAFLKDPKKFTRLGGRIPKGVLMMGSPGTGKTLLARAIAGEAGVPFFSISGSDFVEMFVGVGASRVRDLFEQGKKHAPCIIFIDEIDAVGRHRGAGLGGGHDEREQTLNQLLVEMDGFESNEGVIIIAATNRPDVIDPALLRPGRFDRRIVVNRPDVKGRLGILHVHTRKVPLAEGVVLEGIAKGTPGFSGADLENLVNEAALLAARADKTKVDTRDFEDAKDKVLMGAERKSMIISEKEKRTTAYHEAGHALVARKLRTADPVHKVTIIPRGRALGVTQQLPSEDRLSWSKEFALDRIAIMMGGRIAEELMFNEKTTGAGNDLEQATELARKMVTEWGMSDKMGPLTYSKREDTVFLGREIAQAPTYSEETAQDIDNEIRAIVFGAYNVAREILEQNLAPLKRVAEALLEYETLDGPELDLVVDGQPLPNRTKITARPAAPPQLKQDRPSGFPNVSPEPSKA